MDPPAVSVVLPTRGRAAYLEVALESLRAQDSAAPYDLLVVDDGSTDGTRELLERLDVPALRLDPPRAPDAPPPPPPPDTPRPGGRCREPPRRADRVRRRRRPGAARLAAGTRRRRREAPGRRCVRRSD